MSEILLSEIAHIYSGMDYKRNPPGGIVPIYGTGGLMGFTSLALYNGPAVLSGRKGSINNPMYVEGEFWNVDTIFCIKANDGVDTKWLYYNFLNTDLTKLIEATGVPSVNSRSLYRLKFKWFEFHEQQQIAKILSTADAVIERTQAAIAKYKAIKQGMLQDLFTRGIDLHTNKLRPCYQDAPKLYKESRLGMIPREWEEMSIEESTDYVDYRGKTPPKSDFGIFLVTAKNIRFGYIDYEISKEYIREDSFESAMSRGKVKLGDVLFTTEAPLGNVAQINREDVALAQRVIKYRGFDNLLDNDYLALCLISDGFQRQLFSEATGTTVLGIKGSRLHKLKLAIPTLDEQRFIVERIKAIDAQLSTEQIYLQKMQSLKKGLMEDLLSGKKQVKESTEINEMA